VNPDALLSQLIAFATSLDAAIESGHACDEDHVYALAGLVLELDRWLATGRPLPTRWARPARAPAALLVLGGESASNEVTPRRRHAPVRRRRAAAAPVQLAFPFCAALQG